MKDLIIGHIEIVCRVCGTCTEMFTFNALSEEEEKDAKAWKETHEGKRHCGKSMEIRISFQDINAA